MNATPRLAGLSTVLTLGIAACSTTGSDQAPATQVAPTAATAATDADARPAAFSSLVGPVDVHRITAGGHSYAGSIAFNTSLHDTRVAAVFDLDGRLFGEAAAVPTKVPSLIVTSSGSGTTGDAQMYEVARLGAKTVAVGLLRSDHFDLTDAAAIEDLLHATGASFALGTIGEVAVSDTSTIVQRFLDKALDGHVPTSAALVDGLPATTARPFGTAV